MISGPIRMGSSCPARWRGEVYALFGKTGVGVDAHGGEPAGGRLDRYRVCTVASMT